MKIKPLSVLKLRKLDSIPEYFQVQELTVSLSPRNSRALVQDINSWIEEYLSGRYSIQTLTIDTSTKIRIGIEDPLEFTFFQMGCPFIH